MQVIFRATSVATTPRAIVSKYDTHRKRQTQNELMIVAETKQNVQIIKHNILLT